MLDLRWVDVKYKQNNKSCFFWLLEAPQEPGDEYYTKSNGFLSYQLFVV